MLGCKLCLKLFSTDLLLFCDICVQWKPYRVLQKKDGSNTYTVDVEVAWGDRGSQIVQQSKIRTLSCAYDDHGQAMSPEQNITDW